MWAANLYAILATLPKKYTSFSQMSVEKEHFQKQVQFIVTQYSVLFTVPSNTTTILPFISQNTAII
jgi:hypothetical protein